jgi:hypothetical protein
MKGWYFEKYRHSLAARGIKTSFSNRNVPDEIRWQVMRKSIVSAPNEDVRRMEVRRGPESSLYEDEDVAADLREDILAEKYKARKKELSEEEDEMLMNEYLDEGKKKSYAGFLRWTGKEHIDQSTDDYGKEFIDAPPNSIIGFLDEIGVNTDVPEHEIDFYVREYEADEDLKAPYVLFDEDDEIIESGNIAQLRAAEKVGLGEVPFLVVRENELV